MKIPKLCLHGASLSPLCGLVTGFSSSMLNLAELSSSTFAGSVGQFGNLRSVFLWESALCPGASQGLSLLAGMQGCWYLASTALRLSWAELLGAAGRQDAGVWLRGVCWEEGLNISSALIPGGPSP